MTHWATLRISDFHKEHGGPSIEVQADSILRWAKSQGVTWGKEHDPGLPPGFFADVGVSAYKTKCRTRQGFKQILRHAKAGDTIVCARIDRLFRSMLDFCQTLEWMQSHNLNLVVVEPEIDFASACGRLLAHLLAAFAEFESAIKAERVKAAATAAGNGKKKTRQLRSVDGEYVPIAPMTPQQRDHVKCGRIWVYRRISHKDGVESGRGLEWQHRVGSEEAQRIQDDRPELAYGGEFVDLEVSAYKIPLRERPQGRKLCEIVRPGDVVIFPRLDRGFRNTRDMLNTLPDWIKDGIEVRIVDQKLDFSKWTGMIVLEVLALAAKIEACIISARNKETKHWLDAHGRTSGTTPMFFRMVKHKGTKKLVWDVRAIRIMRYVHAGLAMGFSQRQIEDRLELLLSRRENRPYRKIFGKEEREWTRKKLYNWRALYPKAIELWHRHRAKRWEQRGITRLKPPAISPVYELIEALRRDPASAKS